MAVLGILASIAVPNFVKARNRANTRACFANQKTLAGAVEMYDLDNTTTTTELTPDVLQVLQRQGYLQVVPNDPGSKDPASSANYVMFVPEGEKSATIFCTRHGFVVPPKGCHARTPPADQARAAGVTDESILSRCSTSEPGND